MKTWTLTLLSLPCTAHSAPPQIPIVPSLPTSDPIETIPSIGLGLWNSHGLNATFAVRTALSAHYRHFDGAAAYHNENFVGAGLGANDTAAPPRVDYWLTSKLWNDHHRPDLVPLAFNKTLSQLNTTYLDLYLMHWPTAFRPDTDRTIIDQETTIEATWTAMEYLASAYKASNGAYGARYIGISNFSPRQIDRILSMCTVRPFAHEFETHPYLQQQDFIDWHLRHDIKVIAYSPLANLNPTYDSKLPPILEDQFWIRVAREKNCTVAQAVLGWAIQRGTTVIPKSTHKKYIEENIGAVHVRFTEKEMEYIAEQDKRVRFNDPSKLWGVDLFEDLDGARSLLSDDAEEL